MKYQIHHSTCTFLRFYSKFFVTHLACTFVRFFRASNYQDQHHNQCIIFIFTSSGHIELHHVQRWQGTNASTKVGVDMFKHFGPKKDGEVSNDTAMKATPLRHEDFNMTSELLPRNTSEEFLQYLGSPRSSSSSSSSSSPPSPSSTFSFLPHATTTLLVSQMAQS
eukprot:746758-Hanusia_phi.AAC.1